MLPRLVAPHLALLPLLALAGAQAQQDLCEQEMNRIKDLLQVSCAGKGLSGVPAGLPEATGILLLGSNRLASFSTAWLQHLPDLTDLDLSSNGLAGFEADAALPRLQELVLSHNALESLPALRGTPRLRRLALGHNALAWLPEGGFRALGRLADLELQGNRLERLPAGAFAGLAALKDLDLSDNLLQELPALLLAGLGALQTLRLERNRLRAVPERFFPKDHYFAYVYLEGNPWLCDCALRYLRTWLLGNEFCVYSRVQGPDKEITENAPENVTCRDPPEHAGHPVMHFRAACGEESTEAPPDPSAAPSAAPAPSSRAAATAPGRPPASTATPSTAPSSATSIAPSSRAAATTPGRPPASTAPPSATSIAPSSRAAATAPGRPPASTATPSTAPSSATSIAPSSRAAATAPGRPLASTATLSTAPSSATSIAPSSRAAATTPGRPPASTAPPSATSIAPSSRAAATTPGRPPASTAPSSATSIAPSSRAAATAPGRPPASTADLPAAPCLCPLPPGVALGLSGRQRALSWGAWLAARRCPLRLALYAACLLLAALPALALLCLGARLWLGRCPRGPAAYQPLQAVAAASHTRPEPGGGGRPRRYRACESREVGPRRHVSWLLVPLPGPSGQWPWERAGGLGAAPDDSAAATAAL
ncbi:platelet glycoprotein Ib alpha chain [Eublepharis macularius]|uniref:Platelet glycoprotein Ib alpha chain n=1 Tax=Eublepharis macularius TaxID=481883 RepID=A0AA97K5P8_EUBMA|nr:platelet glycoprotein Ib alpha chain [Eublepharis macularius]